MTARQFDAWCCYNEWIKGQEVIWRPKSLTKDEAVKDSMVRWFGVIEAAGIPIQNREQSGLPIAGKPKTDAERIQHA